jgi:uncharacterized protein (TIRG00374 family)
MTIFKKIWRPLLALLLIAILIAKGPFQIEQLKFILTHSKLVTLGFVIFFLQVLLFSARWKLFINLILKVPLLKVFQLNLIGYFFNYFIPGGVGGDIVKALELSKENKSTRSQALSTVLSDRVFGLFAMISISFAFLLIEYVVHQDSYILKFLFLSGSLFFAIISVLLFLPLVLVKISSHLKNNLSKTQSNLFAKLEKLVTSLHFTFVTFKNFNIQIKSFLISFIGQFLAIYFMYEVVRTLGVTPPSFLIFFALCCFGFLASAIPIFPAGIGVGQAAIFVMFSNINAELAKAAITAITVLQIFNLFYALIGGAIFSFMPKVKQEVEV